MTNTPSNENAASNLPSEESAPVELRQVIGVLIFIGACSACTFGEARDWIGVKYDFFAWWILTAIGCGVGGFLTAWKRQREGFAAGNGIGSTCYLVLQAYVWLRGGVSTLELGLVALPTILFGAWRLWLALNREMTPQGRAWLRRQVEDFQKRADSGLEDAIQSELRRRVDKILDEAVDQTIAQDKRDGKPARTRRQVAAALEAEGYRTRLSEKLRDEVAKEVTMRVEKLSAEMLAKERARYR